MVSAEPIRTPRPEEIYYPDSDGKPMAEGDIHRINATQTIDGLTLFLRSRSDAYVAGNNFIYYEEGNPKKSVSPDAYVVFGVSSRLRKTYQLWKEGGHPPDVVFEFTSSSTKVQDTRTKYRLYEQVLRVKEYFRFDPEGEYMNPRLQGFRLNAGAYQPIEPVNGRIQSEVLGLELVVEGQYLRLFDPRKQEFLPTVQEAADHAVHEAAARRRAEQRAAEEAAERQRAEQRAEEQQQRAEEQQQRADREAEARRLSDAELQRMREELEAMRRQAGSK